VQPSKGAEERAETILRSRRFIVVLLLAAILGVPVTIVAYGFLQLTTSMQGWVFTNLPHGLGFGSMPVWWPLIPLFVAGVVTAAAIRYLPGTGGHVPAEGLQAHGVAPALELPGIAIAALASISLGAVVGPEAPLIALGGGLAVWVVRLIKHDLPAQAAVVMATVGSFAAVSTLLGSPIVGAILLMEVAGLARAVATVVLVPGLLGAGIGALVFTGIDDLTGEGTFSLAVPHLPAVGRPTGAELGWAVVIGLLAAGLCWLLRRGAFAMRGIVERWRIAITPAIGLAIGGLAIGYVEATRHPYSDVLFSGQNQLPGLMENAGRYSVGALLLLIVCKCLAYSGSLMAFRGGPTFPGMFLGAAGGIALSHLPGLPLVAAAGMGMGTMLVGMLGLPFTAVLLTTLFLGSDGVAITPEVIVAVVVAHVATIRLTPRPADDADDADQVRRADDGATAAARG
jgi:H+/Cl- antiporter ClcA